MKTNFEAILKILELKDDTKIIEALSEASIMNVTLNPYLIENGITMFGINDMIVCSSERGIPSVEIYDPRMLDKVIALYVADPSLLYANSKTGVKSLNSVIAKAPKNLFRYSLAIIQITRSGLSGMKVIGEARRLKLVKNSKEFLKAIDNLTLNVSGKNIGTSSVYDVSPLDDSMEEIDKTRASFLLSAYNKYFKDFLIAKINSGAEAVLSNIQAISNEFKIFRSETEKYSDERTCYGNMLNFLPRSGESKLKLA